MDGSRIIVQNVTSRTFCSVDQEKAEGQVIWIDTWPDCKISCTQLISMRFSC